MSEYKKPEDLVLDNGTSLRFLNKDYKNFLNETTIVCGASRSGKSIIVDEITNLCKDYVSETFVFSETDITLSTYYDKLPDECIITSNHLDRLNSILQLRENAKLCKITRDAMANIILIFDDCPSFGKWSKNSDVFKELFYNYRFYNITLIISSQSSKDISCELRRHFTALIFTTYNASDEYFKRPSNAFSEDEKTQAELYSKNVLINHFRHLNHKKLVYFDNSLNYLTNPFFYTIANLA